MKEKYAELLYNTILYKVVIPHTGNKTTYLNELYDVGKMLLGPKFKGVYASDRIPKLSNEYAILNLDTSGEPGSHWISIANHNNKTYVYDSFGRSNVKIIKSLTYSGNGKIIDTDRDVEQDLLETNCGARCLSWLVLFDGWGANVAKLI